MNEKVIGAKGEVFLIGSSKEIVSRFRREDQDDAGDDFILKLCEQDLTPPFLHKTVIDGIKGLLCPNIIGLVPFHRL